MLIDMNTYETIDLNDYVQTGEGGTSLTRRSPAATAEDDRINNKENSL